MSETFVRPASSGYEDFLFNVYASTRLAELGLMGGPGSSRRASCVCGTTFGVGAYEAEFPKAAESILMDGEVAVEYAIVLRGAAEVRLVDIALLPERRN